MRKLKLYLDTSVINFFFAADAPELQKITIAFFNNFVRESKYDVYISEITNLEISRTNDAKKKDDLYSIIEKYKLKVLPGDKKEEIQYLVEKYINKGIIPNKKIEDAFHIAYAVAYEIEYLISWNYKHLANINKEKRILLINEEENYNHFFRMVTPLEVMYEE